MPPDPQRNARLQAKINFPISGKCGFFLLLANTLLLQHMHEKYFFILTNKCETKRLHKNEAKGPWPLCAPQPCFCVKAYSRIFWSK
jgi:hypothetical protein